jgi:CRISPR-associated protein Csm5
MTTYQLTLRTLSPLHIGDGNELRLGFDFVVHHHNTYRLNEDAVLLAKGERLIQDRTGNYPLPGSLLSERDFDNPAFFRYILRGEPRSKRDDARVKSFIKDILDCPYIPGASLKGAFRTALAWTGWKEVNPHFDRSTLGRSKSWAGQPLESKLFGADPNHDLLRALQISDLFGPEKAGQGLLLVNAQVLTLRSKGSPVELEAIAGDVSFQGTLHIDDFLFSPQAEKELHFANRRAWLDELLPRAQAFSRHRLERLASWFERADDASKVAAFYRRLAGVSLGPNQAVLQISWGAGWDGKTFGNRLQTNPQLFENLVSDYRMHKAPKGSPPRKPGDPFPRSRRVAVTVKDGIVQAGAPFGWVLVEINEK